MTWFQALNPIFVFALTPFLIARWRRRAEAGHDGPAIGKMAIGSALVGVSYVMLAILAHVADGQPVNWLRSEEHTSELQSLMRISYAVFCLKKKKQKKQNHTIHINTNTV